MNKLLISSAILASVLFSSAILPVAYAVPQIIIDEINLSTQKDKLKIYANFTGFTSQFAQNYTVTIGLKNVYNGDEAIISEQFIETGKIRVYDMILIPFPTIQEIGIYHSKIKLDEGTLKVESQIAGFTYTQLQDYVVTIGLENMANATETVIRNQAIDQ